jgi:hypothetical protein
MRLAFACEQPLQHGCLRCCESSPPDPEEVVVAVGRCEDITEGAAGGDSCAHLWPANILSGELADLLVLTACSRELYKRNTHRP